MPQTSETGCAVLEAIGTGELDAAAYENYLKIIKESTFFDSSVIERRKKDKAFGKNVKDYKKHINSQD